LDGLYPGNIMLVWAPREVQMQRLQDRDRLDVAAATARLDAQMPIDDKRSRATWVITNDGNEADTERQVDSWWTSLGGQAVDV
jgi:dephospho-CoA kinase